ncbi:hypothetical protein QJQ45_008903 [Haematococcus lacustris]|nr:hypothetical protein QJQ45_008903 [Haematococcus lacustris]
MADYDVFDDAELELNAMDTEEVRPEPVGPPTRNLGELSLEELEQELRRRRARHEQPGQHAEVAAGGSGIAGGNGAVGGGGVAGGSGGVGQPTAPGGTTGGVLTPGSGQVARSGPGGTANHPAPGGPGATGGSGPGSSGGGSQAGEGQAAAAAAAGAGGPGPGANQPGENQVSGFRAVMPNPNVWRMDDVEKGRNVKMFLREVTRWAAVARVPMIDALQLHVADPLKEALFAIAEQAKAERRLMTEEDMEKMFLDLVGADTIQVQHTAMKRLINRECVQGDQSVAQYNVAFRLLAQQVQAFPAGALCEMYVQGLQADLRRECAVMPNGLPWSNLNDVILYALGRQVSMQAGVSKAQGMVAVARGAGSGRPDRPRGGRVRARGVQMQAANTVLKRWLPPHRRHEETELDRFLGAHRGGPWSWPISAQPSGAIASAHGVDLSFVYEASLGGKPCKVMMDTGSSFDLISEKWLTNARKVNRNGQPVSSIKVSIATAQPTVAESIDGKVIRMAEEARGELCMQGVKTTAVLKVVPGMLGQIDVVLGKPWQTMYDAKLLVREQSCHVTTPDGKAHTLYAKRPRHANGKMLAQLTELRMTPELMSAPQAARAVRHGCPSWLLMVQREEGSVSPHTSCVTGSEQHIKLSLASTGLVPESTVTEMVKTYNDVFADIPAGLPPERGVGHTIPLEAGTLPQRARMYRLSQREIEEMKKQVSALLEKGWIEPSASPWGAPVLFVQKKDGSLRMCIDYRALNKRTVRDRYPLPRIDDLLDRVRGKKVFSSLDLQSGYHQIRITPEDVPKTAFLTPMGQFQYKKTMNRIFEPMIKAGSVLVYLDDILVMSNTPEEHVQHLRQVLELMRAHKLFAKLSKCEFNRPELAFLGHIVGRNGVAVDPAKVKVVAEWPQPRGLKELQAFLGLCNFFRRFIRGYSSVAAPLTDLTRQDKQAAPTGAQHDARVQVAFAKDPQVKGAFQALKAALCSAPVLALPDFSKPYLVWTDASLQGTGGVLMQEGRVVAYTSKKFTPAQTRYTTGEQELLAIVRALQEWRCYLDGAVGVTIVTDHNPLVYLASQTNLSRRVARWVELMSRFKYEIKHKPGAVNIADPISRSVQQMQQGSNKDDDEEEAVGAVVLRREGQVLVMTRRQARQTQPSIAHAPPVPREQDSAQQAEGQSAVERTAGAVRPGGGEVPLPRRSPCATPAEREDAERVSEVELARAPGGSLHDFIIEGYSHDPLFQSGKAQERLSRSERGLWLLRDRVWVPRSPLVKQAVLEKCHDDAFAGHVGITKTKKLVSRHFYWPGWDKDVEDYVRHCDACQRNKPSCLLKAGKLQPLSVPGKRWEHVSMDMIVKLPTSGEERYDSILVFVDRLSKMVHLVPTHESIDNAKFARLFKKNVIRLHGKPSTVLSDRGAIFNSENWREICWLLGMRIAMSTAYHPESDGQTERVNRVVEEMLRAYISPAQSDWSEHLDMVEFAINNSWHESLQNTPFFLNYGEHPLTPASEGLPRSGPKAHSFVQGILQAIKKAKQCWAEAQQKMKAREDGRRRHVSYNPEQLIMLSTENMRRKVGDVGVRKLKPRYVGPFRVLHMVGDAAVKIQLPHQWRVHNVFHVSLVKPYVGDAVPNLVAPPPDRWEDGQPVYEVEKLVDHRFTSGYRPQLEFLVKWVGYPSQSNTWEPLVNLQGSMDLVREYAAAKNLHIPK